MKIISSAVLVALFAVCQGRFLDATTTPSTVAQTYGSASFSNSLNCGQCIGLGHTYCVKQAEHVLSTSYQSGTTNQKCIQQFTSDPFMTDVTYSCSNAFNDRVYSKYVCQVNTGACGTSDSFTLANTNSTAAVNITNLALGQTCFYKVQATCGGPAFKPTDATKVEIEYVEFRQDELDVNSTVTGYTLGSNNTVKRASQPVAGMPRRDRFFNTDMGGNMIANANQTVFNATGTSLPVIGKSGRFDKTNTGRKVYGNNQQGDTVLANLTNQAHSDCATRNLYLAVTGIDTTGATLRVDFSSVAFYRPPTVTPTTQTTGATFVSMSLAAVLGLISLAFF